MGFLSELYSEIIHRWRFTRVSQMAAALSFYAFFALTPLLVMIISFADKMFGGGIFQNQFIFHIENFIGVDNRLLWEDAIEQIPDVIHIPFVSKIIAVIVVLIGASAVFVQFKDILNSLWGVSPNQRFHVFPAVRNRFLGLLMIIFVGVVFAALVFASVFFVTVGSIMAEYIKTIDYLPLIHGGDIVISFFMGTVFFAMLFKYIPDAIVKLKDVWIGALVTSILFALGKGVLIWYLGQGTHALYGAFSSVLAVMVWLYISIHIVLFGAQIVYVHALRNGRPITPLMKN